MSNGLYKKGKQKILEGSIAWLTDDIKIVLVDLADYTPNLNTDTFLSDIPVAARVATSGNLASKTSTDGVADAADVTVASVTGDQFEAVVGYKDTGNAATSPLIWYADSGAGFPGTPSGGDFVIVFSNAASKIFEI